MGVMQPDISVTADPALLLQPATAGAVDSYFLSNDLDPDGKLRHVRSAAVEKPLAAPAGDRGYG